MAFDHGRVRVRVVMLLLGCGCSDARVERGDTASFRATLLSSEHAVDQLAPQRPVLGRWPAAAFNGTEYLVVWEDHRTRSMLYGGRSMLYGGRVAVDGTALDEFGFRILDAIPWAWPPVGPAVASDGDGFLIALRVEEQILGIRVSAAGEVLDLNGIVIAGVAARPSLAFDGENYLVVWSQSGSGIYRARVKPDGTVLDPGGVLAWGLGSSSSFVGISFDGTNYLLSWVDIDAQTLNPLIRAGRIAPDGTLIDESPISISMVGEGVAPKLSPVAAFDGSNHVIAWMQHELSPQWEGCRISASRVTPEGMLLDPNGLSVFEHEGGCTGITRLGIAAASERSVVVSNKESWGDAGSSAGFVRVHQIAADGTISVHPADELVFGMEPTLAMHPDGGLLLWRDGDDNSADYLAITGTMLDAAGVPTPDEAVAPAWPASREVVTAVASAGQMFFVLWEDTRDPASNGTALYGARVAADGTPLDPEPIQITDHWSAGANVVFDGANFVVTWVRWRHDSFRTVRVSLAGEVLDAEPLYPPLHTTEVPAGASDGSHTLLVGESIPSQLAAVLLDHDGVVVSDVVEIAGKDDNHAGHPGVSFDGTGYLVVWNDWNDVAAQRINKDGELEGPRILAVAKDSAYFLGVAGGDGMHMMLWQDAWDGTGEVWVTRVTADGQVLDPNGLAVAIDLLANPTSVAFNGTNFFVAWRTNSNINDANSHDLRAIEVTPAGELSSEFAISTEPGSETAAILAGGNGRVLAAYSRFVPGAPYESYRAQARVLTTLSAMELDVQAPVPGGMGAWPDDVQAGGSQTPSEEHTLPSPHSASELHGAFLPAGSPAGSPALSAQGSSPM